MLPVLCGYFNKIVGSLLTKERQKFLEFILLQRNGEFFDGLMKHISHHSLALLLVELLQINIKADEPSGGSRDEGRKKGFSMLGSDGSDGSDGTDELDDHNNEEPVLTPDQIHMKNVLSKKSKHVVMSLLDCLSSKNQDNLEKTLNANTILNEFCDDDQSFALMTTPEALTRLI